LVQFTLQNNLYLVISCYFAAVHSANYCGCHLKKLKITISPQWINQFGWQLA